MDCNEEILVKDDEKAKEVAVGIKQILKKDIFEIE